MKKLLYFSAFLIIELAFAQSPDSAQVCCPGQQEILVKYHFNKNYNYELDTVPLPNYSSDSIIKLAKTFIGTSYLANGKLPGGFDCSGFMFYLHRQFGVYLPYYSFEVAEIGTEIPKESARPGDLIMFKGSDLTSTHAGHVGMVISPAGQPIKFIHSSTSKGVRIDALENNPYFKPRFIFVRRIVE